MRTLFIRLLTDDDCGLFLFETASMIDDSISVSVIKPVQKKLILKVIFIYNWLVASDSLSVSLLTPTET